MTSAPGSEGGPVDRDELVARFASFPDRLAAAARAAEGRPVTAGEWTPNQNVRHLIAVEGEVWRARLASLAAGGEPQWAWVEPAPVGDFPGASLAEILGAYAGMRASTAEFVRLLDDSGWARAGVHETYGRLDVAGLLRLAIDHDEEHESGLRAAD